MSRTEATVVEISSGRIQGLATNLPDKGGVYYCFKGIPYAEPPVGPLRFRSPQPLERHSDDVLDCTAERSVSLASDYFPPCDGRASEDCLFLNVYSPTAPSGEDPVAGSDDPLPVMVWLHGGAFCTGSANASIYDPAWLVAQGVIVVTVNYRLGPAGFLCLPSVGIYGNMGLKDQRLALSWVRTNIARFGGDPTNVTLFGESAGGVSTHLHCLSEGSCQLFHKAICQSGVATGQSVIRGEPEAKARRLAEHFGCPPGASDEEVLETLTNVDPELLAKSQKQALTAYEQTLDSKYPFRPVAESRESPDPIITEDVFDLLRKPNGTRMPMIVGVTNEEALYKINALRRNPDRYRNETVRFIPETLNVPHEERSGEAQSIIDFYCGPEGVCLEKELQLSRIFTDIFYLVPAVLAAELHLANRAGAIFFYQFAAETELNKFRQLWKVPPEYRGAGHADDVCYLFGSGFFATDTVDRGSEAWTLRDAMCRLWTSFARTGTPRLKGAGATWTPLEAPNGPGFGLSALTIGSDITMVPNHLHERVQFWRELYQKFNHLR